MEAAIASYGPVVTSYLMRTLSRSAASRDSATLEHAACALSLAGSVVATERRKSFVAIWGKAASKIGYQPDALLDAPGARLIQEDDLLGRYWTEAAWLLPWSELGVRESSTKDGFCYRRWWRAEHMSAWEQRLSEVTAFLADLDAGYGLWHMPCAVDETVAEIVEMARNVSPFELTPRPPETVGTSECAQGLRWTHGDPGRPGTLET